MNSTGALKSNRSTFSCSIVFAFVGVGAGDGAAVTYGLEAGSKLETRGHGKARISCGCGFVSYARERRY